MNMTRIKKSVIGTRLCKDIWASELRLHEVSAARKTVGESEAVSIARTISWLLYDDFLSEFRV